MFVTRPMLAKHYSCHQSTISNWVKKGLLPPPSSRTPTGRPLWSADLIAPKVAGEFPHVDVDDLESDAA
jgi:hypothetical protein